MTMLGESVRRRQRHRETQIGPRPRPWLTWLIGIPLALVAPFAIGYFIAVRTLFPPPVASGTGIPVPDLIGKAQLEAEQVVRSAGLAGIELMTFPHPSAPAGQVIAQSPLPGQQLRGGAFVQVALSSGRPRVRLPDVIGFSADAAQSMLQRTGFEVILARQESEGTPGRVIAMDPKPGQVRQLPSTVTIVVSTPLAVDPVGPADTVRRDTLSTAHHPSSATPPPDQAPFAIFVRPAYREFP
jgi:beta-lactam-binding protein with PASTA domain